MEKPRPEGAGRTLKDPHMAPSSVHTEGLLGVWPKSSPVCCGLASLFALFPHPGPPTVPGLALAPQPPLPSSTLGSLSGEQMDRPARGSRWRKSGWVR